ncbi:hypothetical protein SBRCBS47491_001813 [Sporothrix bragantina]|uniref:CBM6 domain-containing protein n=1 Tax=Sporothrix bragantina TaxID=671064 RepID=A0ABP0B1T7_9PEZI
MKVSCLMTAPLLWAGIATAVVCKPKPPPVCTNLLSAPDFDPPTAWIHSSAAINPPSDNSWAQVKPCGDYDSCIQITSHSNAILTIQSFTYPYSGAYTASLKYKVLDPGSGVGTLNFGLDSSDPGAALTTVSDGWQDYTDEYNADAGTHTLVMAVNTGNTVTVQITDVQILACE